MFILKTQNIPESSDVIAGGGVGWGSLRLTYMLADDQIKKCSELTQTDIRERWKQLVVKPH